MLRRAAAIYTFSLVGLILFASSLAQSGLAKSAPSPWLSATPPTIDKIEDLPEGTLPPYSIDGNRDCQEREVILRPQRFLPIPQSQISHTGCFIDTAFGAVSSGGGLLQRQGSTIAGPMVRPTGAGVVLIPVPRSSIGLYIAGSAPTGAYVTLTNNFGGSLSSLVTPTGEVMHTIDVSYTIPLSDRSGTSLPIVYDSISFSPDGLWMVADVPFVGTIRVNLETFDVLPFGGPMNYNIGLAPSLQTAITTNGRYAALASKTYGIFQLFDLSTCAAVPQHITGPVNCKFRDLMPLMRQQVPGFEGAGRLRFRSDGELEFYGVHLSGGKTKIARYTLNASGQKSGGFEYLALGDSFASGEGAYQYKALTDTKTNKCHLSQRSYPYLIGSALGLNQYESVACSGAVIDDLNNLSDEYKGQVKDGIKRVNRKNVSKIIAGPIPGYLAQAEILKHVKPTVITLSAVGNDIGFGDKIKRCLGPDTCFSSYEDRLEIVREINSKFYDLTKLYTDLKATGNPRARIYVIGYPQVAQPGGRCDLNVRLNNDEIKFSRDLISYLNKVIKTAAANAGVYYVDVEDAFIGARLCETQSWNVAVNGLSLGNDIPNLPLVHGPFGNESYHPNAIGHNLFKTKILKNTANLSAPMPKPNPSAVISNQTDDLVILNAPKTNRRIRLIRKAAGTNGGVIQTGKTWLSTYSDIGLTLKAGSKVHGWLNSNPVDLGTFKSNKNGDIKVSFTLPAGTPSGFHTLHLYGQNTSGEDVDFYETVYVDSGDGTSGLCNSGQDSDQDKIDDACDPFIDKAPAPKTQPPAGGTTVDADKGEIMRADQTAPTGAVNSPNTPPSAPAAAANPNTLAAQTALPQVAGANTVQSPDASDIKTSPRLPQTSRKKTSLIYAATGSLIVASLLIFTIYKLKPRIP